MNHLIATEIPDSSAEIANWLEDVICRGDLRGLVAQLSAIHHSPASQLDIESLLADNRQAVLSNGLSALSSGQVQQLLTNPVLLLDLQEWVMIDRGSYWQRQFDSPVASIVPVQVAAPVGSPKPGSRNDHRHRNRILTLAAMVLVSLGGVWLYQRSGSREVANGTWGWAAENALPTSATPQQYMAALSEGANAWFSHRPTNHDELKQRLSEFAAGCQQLIDSRHPLLSEGDEKRLWYACQQWQAKIESQLASIDQTSFNFALAQADALAHEIAAALPALARDA